MNELINLLNSNKLDYSVIKEKALFRIFDDKLVDINFIIPVKNRVTFAKPLYESFLKAKANTDLNIAYTMVEISEINEHQAFCEKNKINYVWVKTNYELFNKCIGLNVGAMFTVNSKSFIFHDIDCLIQSDFFVKLEENIKNKQAEAIQCFHGRRVLYLDNRLTNLAINGLINIDEFKLGNEGISLPENIGAPGGSIYITKDLFFKVGGFESEFFVANAPEDAFFWDKVDVLSKMHISDEPNIDIFHMNHIPTHSSNPHIYEMLKILNIFRNYSKDEKINYINEKSKLINEYRN
jgi:predicted glycosyltransferase involved in capsule biosynthesis